ncbi:N-acetyl-D-Glu racemase DgcA [Thalassotalea fusca]
MISLRIVQVDFPLASEFRIARGAKTKAEVVEVHLSDGVNIGRAESVPYNRYQETRDSVVNQLTYVQHKLSRGYSIENILSSMAPGAAKNALDCAQWDLKAKQYQKPVHRLLDIQSMASCVTAQTLSIDTPEKMAEAAAKLEHPKLIKVKLDNQDIVDRMAAIKEAAPLSQFIVDANEGWSLDDLVNSADALAALNVVLIEQPLAVGKDDALLDLNLPISLCADESCHTRRDLPYLKGRYDAINIKLDKTGGLTEAFKLCNDAIECGFEIMVGCMVGSSLAMAPAFLLSSQAKYVDLDGPLIVAKDREYGFQYQQGNMSTLNDKLWGGISDNHYR